MIINIVLLILIFFILIVIITYLFSNKEKYDYTPPEKNCVRLSHGFTHFELSGPESAPVIVLIHGGTIPMCTWDDQVNDFVKAGFRVLRYDQYGRGESERLRIPYTRQIFAEQLLDLLNYLKINEPVNIIGPSFGGAISVLFAANCHERVKSLVLISPVLNLLKSNSPLTMPIKISSIPVIGDIIFRTVIRNRIIARGIELSTSPSCKEKYLNQFYCRGTEYSFLSIFRNDVYGDYRQETISTGKHIKNILLVRGKNDREVNAQMVQQAKNDLSNCRFLEIEDSGHSPFTMKNSNEFMKVLIDFFNEN